MLSQIKIRNSFVFILKFFILINIFLTMPGYGEQPNSFTAESSSSDSNPSIPTIPPGSPEHIVSIDKEIYPEKDYYMPSESIRILVTIKFLKYKSDPWNLKNFQVYELVDNNLEFDDKSVHCDIFNNPLEINNIKPEYIFDNNGIPFDENGFLIEIPGEFNSTNTIIYRYNVTLEKPGFYNTRTILKSGPDVGFYSNIDKSLKIHASDYEILAQYWIIIKGIIWIIVIFSAVLHN